MEENEESKRRDKTIEKELRENRGKQKPQIRTSMIKNHQTTKLHFSIMPLGVAKVNRLGIINECCENTISPVHFIHGTTLSELNVNPRSSGNVVRYIGRLLQREQKALGGFQILLGFACISVGVFLYVFPQSSLQVVSGSPFWTGVMFIISGSFSVESENQKTPGWLLSAFVMNLINSVAAVAGAVIAEEDLRWSSCDYENYRASDVSYTGNYLGKDCYQIIHNLEVIIVVTKIILLILMVLELGITLYFLAYACHHLCSQEPSKQVDEHVREQSKPLLISESSPSPFHKEKLIDILLI